jgi:hypothetical protein
MKINKKEKQNVQRIYNKDKEFAQARQRGQTNATRGGGETGYYLPDEIEDIKILLNHSDCDGELTPQECRKIYNVIKAIDCDYPRYGEFREAFKCFSIERLVVRFL